MNITSISDNDCHLNALQCTFNLIFFQTTVISDGDTMNFMISCVNTTLHIRLKLLCRYFKKESSIFLKVLSLAIAAICIKLLAV
jgi:hypothetical protein